MMDEKNQDVIADEVQAERGADGAAEAEEDGSQAPGVTVAELQKLQEERDALNDRLLRKQAELENYRKRVEREKTEYIQWASSELIRELLNVLDSFDMAIRNASTDSPASENMLQGFSLINKQLQDTLARFGVKPIEAKGQPFDPNVHQAVSTTPTDEADENTVVEEMRKGYMLNGRLLRPSMVSVAVKGS
jgi:molecular chaperone GrpE